MSLSIISHSKISYVTNSESYAQVIKIINAKHTYTSQINSPLFEIELHVLNLICDQYELR